MNLVRRHGGWAITASLIVALVLMIVPLPGWAEIARPEWPLLVLVYWCLALPSRIGVGISWLVGLCVDVLGGGLLGEHGLGYVLVAYLVVKLHLRIRVYPEWQQAGVVLLLLLLAQMTRLWVLGITGRAPDALLVYFLPSVVGMLLWPFLMVLLRGYRRRFAVT
ncbi:MAG: rod shape-determining protein MreD [Gammaproteobacteria bacterium]|nr:rod shape-determining protein MreD [Gammaproteobacteria bacterium]